MRTEGELIIPPAAISIIATILTFILTSILAPVLSPIVTLTLAPALASIKLRLQRFQGVPPRRMREGAAITPAVDAVEAETPTAAAPASTSTSASATSAVGVAAAGASPAIGRNLPPAAIAS